MRVADPLILGAGPAGCAAATVLALGGARPLLLDRDAQAGDALCGGFLSWQTTRQLRELGIDPLALGAHQVTGLAIFARGRSAVLKLPHKAYGLSRRTLDNAMRARAIAAGAQFETDTIRAVDGLSAVGQAREWRGSALFLACGKHDIRGAGRPREAPDPALGLRIRLPPSRRLGALVGDRIELHLFAGGYAGIVLQEGGSANVCLAVRKSLLARAGGRTDDLLAMLGEIEPAFAQRLGGSWDAPDTIAAIPYGFIARDTRPGLFRLGDQAAVIPSLAGEGISIALASGALAARSWFEQEAAGAPSYQRDFAARAHAPLRYAGLAWRLAETAFGQALAMAAAHHLPGAMMQLMERTRLR